MKQDIVDTATAAGTFNILAPALTEAGLVETLKGDGPQFSTHRRSVGQLPEDELKATLENKDLLTSILTYHVVPGKVLAEASNVVIDKVLVPKQ